MFNKINMIGIYIIFRTICVLPHEVVIGLPLFYTRLDLNLYENENVNVALIMIWHAICYRANDSNTMNIIGVCRSTCIEKHNYIMPMNYCWLVQFVNALERTVKVPSHAFHMILVYWHKWEEGDMSKMA